MKKGEDFRWEREMGGLIPPLYKSKIFLDKNETMYSRMDQIKFVDNSL